MFNPTDLKKFALYQLEIDGIESKDANLMWPDINLNPIARRVGLFIYNNTLGLIGDAFKAQKEAVDKKMDLQRRAKIHNSEQYQKKAREAGEKAREVIELQKHIRENLGARNSLLEEQQTGIKGLETKLEEAEVNIDRETSLREEISNSLRKRQKELKEKSFALEKTISRLDTEERKSNKLEKDLTSLRVKYALTTKKLEELARFEPGYDVTINQEFQIVTAGKKFAKLYRKKLQGIQITGYNLLSLLDDKKVATDIGKAVRVGKENFHIDIPLRAQKTWMIMNIEFTYEDDEFTGGKVNLKKLPFYARKPKKRVEETKKGEIYKLSDFKEENTAPEKT